MRKARRFMQQDQLLPAAGWLFADLLLALAMIFLISNISPIAALPARPTPTPTPIPTPTVTLLPADALILDKNVVEITVNATDPQALINGDANAQNQLMLAIRQEITKRHLEQRRAGIVLAYGGAENNTVIDQALNVSQQAYNVMGKMGSDKIVFCKTVFYHTLYNTVNALNTVVIDIFFYSKTTPGCNASS